MLNKNKAFATLSTDTVQSEEQLSALINQKLPIIRRMASTAVCPGLDFDDAVQEGIIGLFAAIGSYSSDKDASFSTYSNVCIQNAIATAVRTASRKKHSPLNASVSLEDNAISPSPEEIAIQNESYAETLHKIQSSLSNFERRVLQLHMQGKSYSVVAKQLGVSEKSVDNALKRVRQKLRR